MRRFLKAAARTAVVLVFVFLALTGATMSFLHSPFFRYPTDGEYPPPRINELIWPTIGYPALAHPGGEMVVEVDLGTKDEGLGSGGEGAEWRAHMSPCREELAGLGYELEFAGSRLGPSARWPGRGGEVWHISFRVPGEVVPELYDLDLEAETGKGHIYDRQPHAVSVVDGDGSAFTFITLSDIHVHERGNSSLFKRQTDKGISADGEPVYFQQAITQVNLIRPDFVLVLGDFVRGQRRPGELLTELERFYDALLRLEVPAFLLPGNHDGYVNGIDGKRWYETNIGPLYYSFDVGACHIACLDTYQWSEDDRVVMNKLVYMEPRKWQGQVLGAVDEADPSTFLEQLAWLEEDMAASGDYPLKVMSMHHDPFTPEGKGYSYANVVRFPVFLGAGGGVGREALLGIASRHGVGAVFGGHLHRDSVGSVPWEDGTGETTYSCQTCVYFGAGGVADHYPGYRLVEVEGGEIVSMAYMDGVSSFPFYDGSEPGGETDLDSLERPAIWKEAVEGVAGAGRDLEIWVGNHLARRMTLSGLVVPVERSESGEYEVEGAEVYRVVPVPSSPERVLLYLACDVAAGVPGESGDSPGAPAVRTVTVRVSPREHSFAE